MHGNRVQIRDAKVEASIVTGRRDSWPMAYPSAISRRSPRRSSAGTTGQCVVAPCSGAEGSGGRRLRRDIVYLRGASDPRGRVLPLRQIRISSTIAPKCAPPMKRRSHAARRTGRISSRPENESEIPTKERACTEFCAQPGGGGRAPIVIMCMGLDSAKEKCDAYESLFLARGIDHAQLDGPGRAKRIRARIRGDYEIVVKSVVDWVEARSDPMRSAWFVGSSLGGYYAPRAALEKRVKACIALSGRMTGPRSGPR